MTAQENAARPKSGVRLVRLEDLPDPGARAVDFRSGEQLYSMIVARSGGAVRGYDNVCPHAGLPLDRPDGRIPVSDGHLVCAVHGASFVLETGLCAGGPATGRLTSVAVRIEDGWVVTA